jgi:hypothetical protein
MGRERLDEGTRIDQRSAGGVDQDRMRLHQLECRPVQEVPVGGRRAGVQTDDIRLAEERSQVSPLDARNRSLTIRVEAFDVHVPPGQPLRDCAADVPQAYQADGAARQRVGEHTRPPTALAHVSHRPMQQVLLQSEDHRHRMLGDVHDLGLLGRVCDQNAPPRRRIDVDVVDAHAEFGYVA